MSQHGWPPAPGDGTAAPQWQAPPIEPGPAPGTQFAPHGERLLAYIVDSLIVSLVIFAAVIVIGIVTALAYGMSANNGPGSGVVSGAFVATIVLLTFAVIILALLYFPFFWARGGQTPGMKLFGLYVVRDSDGGRIGWGAALLRLIGYWVSGAVFYLGFIWIFFDDRRRGWHDLIAGTLVVKR
jgi:uncharacterized RDD family membrane protein YckC